MKKIQSLIQADKAERYFESLSKHFARKVRVDKTESSAKVFFPMGICLIKLDKKNISFHCEAETVDDLTLVRQVIDVHVNRFGELKDQPMDWN